jgi:hypothetical protein
VRRFTDEADTTRAGEIKKILLQVGTNTLSHVKDPERTMTELVVTIDKLKLIFPEARIYVSAFLPRKDNLHDQAMQVNKLIEEYCDTAKNVSYIQHRNINKKDLFDRLHLHTGGFQKFLWNFRSGMFGLMPRFGGKNW